MPHGFHNSYWSPSGTNTRYRRYRSYSPYSDNPNGSQRSICRNHNPTYRKRWSRSSTRNCFHHQCGLTQSHTRSSNIDGGIYQKTRCYTSGRTRSRSYHIHYRRRGLRHRSRRCGGRSRRYAKSLCRTHLNQSAGIYNGRSRSGFASRRTTDNALCILHQTIYPCRALSQRPSRTRTGCTSTSQSLNINLYH